MYCIAEDNKIDWPKYTDRICKIRFNYYFDFIFINVLTIKQAVSIKNYVSAKDQKISFILHIKSKMSNFLYTNTFLLFAFLEIKIKISKLWRRATNLILFVCLSFVEIFSPSQFQPTGRGNTIKHANHSMQTLTNTIRVCLLG